MPFSYLSNLYHTISLWTMFQSPIFTWRRLRNISLHSLRLSFTKAPSVQDLFRRVGDLEARSE